MMCLSDSCLGVVTDPTASVSVRVWSSVKQGGAPQCWTVQKAERPHPDPHSWALPYHLPYPSMTLDSAVAPHHSPRPRSPRTLDKHIKVLLVLAGHVAGHAQVPAGIRELCGLDLKQLPVTQDAEPLAGGHGLRKKGEQTPEMGGQEAISQCFFYCFGAIPGSTRGLLLALHHGITPDGAQGAYGVLGIQPGGGRCTARALPVALRSCPQHSPALTPLPEPVLRVLARWLKRLLARAEATSWTPGAPAWQLHGRGSGHCARFPATLQPGA